MGTGWALEQGPALGASTQVTGVRGPLYPSSHQAQEDPAEAQAFPLTASLSCPHERSQALASPLSHRERLAGPRSQANLT